MMASVCGLWPQCGQLETTQATTLKSGSGRTLLQFLNLPGWGENCIGKFSRHTPLHTPGAWWPRCAASGLSVDSWRPPRPSHWSQDQAGLYFSSWIFLALEGTASEVQLFQRGGGGRVYYLPAGLPIKENLGDPVVSQQPVMDTATPLVDTTW